MRTILVIGVGTGRPTLLTQQAIQAIRGVDVFFAMDKGEGRADLVAVRRECISPWVQASARFVVAPDPERTGQTDGVSNGDRGGEYVTGVTEWTRARAAILAPLIEKELPDGGCGGFLAWGDPAFYDSTLRVLDRCVADFGLQVDIEVVAGVSSLQLLAAAHGISLTRVGRPLVVTTGRKLREQGFPPGADDAVVMLDAGTGFADLDEPETEIFWGAYLGSDNELLIAGRLCDVADRIVTLRAKARHRHGWVMDTYLLRRPIKGTA